MQRYAKKIEQCIINMTPSVGIHVMLICRGLVAVYHRVVSVSGPTCAPRVASSSEPEAAGRAVPTRTKWLLAALSVLFHRVQHTRNKRDITT